MYALVHEDRETIFDDGFESRSSCAVIFDNNLPSIHRKRNHFRNKHSKSEQIRLSFQQRIAANPCFP